MFLLLSLSFSFLFVFYFFFFSRRLDKGQNAGEEARDDLPGSSEGAAKFFFFSFFFGTFQQLLSPGSLNLVDFSVVSMMI